MANQDLFAETILHQLGGRRFLVMTGTKNLVKDTKKRSISMQLTRNKLKAKYLTITLNAMDTYDMEFRTVNKNYEFKTLASHEGIYCDQLQDIFTAETGLYTQL